MSRANVAAVLVLAVALAGTAVVPVTAQFQSTDDPHAQQDTARLSEPDPDESLANGTGGKVNRGRENDEEQQFLGKTTFKIDDHTPGATGNSFNIYAEGFSENIRMHWNVVQQGDFDFSSCTSNSARAFGIDRGNDDSGTQTDESLLTAYQSVTYTQDNIYVEFFKEEGIAGSPVNITVNDQIVSRVADCLTNPAEPGWYRMTGYVNGSTKMDATTDYTIYGAARFVYVCEGCDSREAAVDKLGPPPTTCPTKDEFAQDSKQWTCRTEDGTYYTNSDPPGEDDGSSPGTPTPTAKSTATPGSDGGTPTGTATATSTPGGDDGTPTAKSTGTSSPTTTPKGDGPQQQQTGTGTVTATRQERQGPASTATGSVPETPTVANGPGFGALLALVGLLAVALFAHRRD